MLETIGRIKSVVEGLNALFNQERKLLCLLEKDLNRMGDPSVCFRDPTPFLETAKSEGTKKLLHYLEFHHGEIRVISIKDTTGPELQDPGVSNPLSMVSLSLVDGILEQLPLFLEKYRNILDGKEEEAMAEHTNNIGKLALIVDAVRGIVSAK